MKLVNKKEIRLIIKDNGIGFSGSLSDDNSETMGIKIVNTLVRQIEGKIEYNRNQGSEFIISFNAF
jgi:two-component sensor histidine kinase